MSIIPPGGFSGRRRYVPPRNNQTWDQYQEHHHGMGSNSNSGRTLISKAPTSPVPYNAFQSEASSAPIVMNSRIEWKETPEAHVYKAHLPGVKRNDVRVEVEDDRVLCIICEKSVEKEEQGGGWHRVELSSGQFVQRLTLPENSMVDHVKAYMDNAVLTVTVPKHSRVANNRVRNVNISSRA
ncbi:hypothetical protein RJT34_17488 [Clitoria ternatea]|uniref:SHSP domain-containing protein n=1 Tax=Clitoria ternatea TaxID=43366 RepID=A0AAN9JAC1_CLITE